MKKLLLAALLLSAACAEEYPHVKVWYYPSAAYLSQEVEGAVGPKEAQAVLVKAAAAMSKCPPSAVTGLPQQDVTVTNIDSSKTTRKAGKEIPASLVSGYYVCRM